MSWAGSTAGSWNLVLQPHACSACLCVHMLHMHALLNDSNTVWCSGACALATRLLLLQQRSLRLSQCLAVASCLIVRAGRVVEVAVPDHGYHVGSAFNDMSLHTFRA
jgi:hypothetical protein